MLQIHPRDGVTIVELAHGKVNALDLELLEALTSLFDQADPGPIVLTGSGRSFSAGVDLQRVAEGGADYVKRFLPALTDAFLAVFTHPGPVIAAINGHALAGGCIIAAACDVRVAAEGPAQIGLTELSVGVPFPTSAIEIVRHAVGDTYASQLVYTAQRLGPREAHRIGLVTDLIDEGKSTLDAAVDIARTLGGHDAHVYEVAKRQLRRDTLERIAARRPEDEASITEVWAAPSMIERVRAYLEGVRQA